MMACKHQNLQLQHLTLVSSHVGLKTGTLYKYVCVECGNPVGIDRTFELEKRLNHRFDKIERALKDLKLEVRKRPKCNCAQLKFEFLDTTYDTSLSKVSLS